MRWGWLSTAALVLLVSSGMRKVPAWDAMEGPRGSSIRNGSEQGWGWWKAPTSDPPPYCITSPGALKSPLSPGTNLNKPLCPRLPVSGFC